MRRDYMAVTRHFVLLVSVGCGGAAGACCARGGPVCGRRVSPVFQVFTHQPRRSHVSRRIPDPHFLRTSKTLYYMYRAPQAKVSK